MKGYILTVAIGILSIEREMATGTFCQEHNFLFPLRSLAFCYVHKKSTVTPMLFHSLIPIVFHWKDRPWLRKMWMTNLSYQIRWDLPQLPFLDHTSYRRNPTVIMVSSLTQFFLSLSLSPAFCHSDAYQLFMTNRMHKAFVRVILSM